MMSEKELLAFPGESGVQVVETRVRDSSISSVVVYQDRAEVKRVVPVHLTAGENEVIVSDLAECVDKNSVRVEGQGKAVITDVIYSSKTTSEEQQPASGSKEQFESLKQEIEECQRELKHLKFREEVLKKEKQLLAQFASHVSKIHSVKNEDDALSHLVDQGTVTAVMDFFEKYEAKTADLDGRLLALGQDVLKVTGKIAALQANADKVDPGKKAVSKEAVRTLHIGLKAPEETDAVLLVSYVVSNASWSSAYDVRVFTKDKSMKVQYYGLIKQQTGEDWKNAKISLSTAQPSIGGSAPNLPTRLIHFKRPRPKISHHYLAAPASASYMMDEYDPTIEDSYFNQSGEFYLQAAATSFKKKSRGIGLGFGGGRGSRRRDSSPSPPPALEVQVAEVTTGLFNTTYAIPRTSTIPADNTEHKVTVALIDLSPEFHYSSVPRLSPYSFLQAKAKNTSPYTMLAGPANVFLDNNFIAKSQLSDVSPNEDFTTSLGVDQSIRITCQPVSTVHNTRGRLVGGKSNSITYSHVFVVKNTRSEGVSIQVLEQVPLSTDDRIKVAVSEPDVRKQEVKCPLPYGYAILNDSNNIEWHATVESGAELQLRLVYTVEHPAQDAVEGLPK